MTNIFFYGYDAMDLLVGMDEFWLCLSGAVWAAH